MEQKKRILPCKCNSWPGATVARISLKIVDIVNILIFSATKHKDCNKSYLVYKIWKQYYKVYFGVFYLSK